MRRARLVGAPSRAVVKVLVVLAASAIGCLASAPVAAGRPPNIIVIQTDDQDNGTVNERVMPNVKRLLSSVGTTFTDYIDSGPLCCPSRAVLLTGQYGHNNGVMWNAPNPYGDLIGKDNTVPVWLQQAGYVTAHVGKYLNSYGKAVSSRTRSRRAGTNGTRLSRAPARSRTTTTGCTRTGTTSTTGRASATTSRAC